MQLDIEFQKLVIGYIDDFDDEPPIDLSQITEYINEHNLFDFLKLISEISYYHPHYNNPERFHSRILELLDPFIETIRSIISVNGDDIKKLLTNINETYEKINTKILDLQNTYSYINCNYIRNTDTNKRDKEFRKKFLLNIVSRLMDYDDTIYDIESILNDVEKDFIRITSHDESNRSYDFVSDYEWNIVTDVGNNNNDEYYWFQAYRKYDYYLFPNDPIIKREYPEHGEMDSCFDTLHDLLLFLENFFGYDSKRFTALNYCNSITEKKEDINYISLYILFTNNKRVLKWLLNNELLINEPRVFDYEFIQDDVENIIDHDDVEYLKAYISSNNDYMKVTIPNRYIKYHDKSWPSKYREFNIFQYAIARGSYNIFKYLITNSQVHSSDYIYAILGGNMNIIQYIENNAKIYYEGILYYTALHSYNFELMKYINMKFYNDIFSHCIETSCHLREWIVDNHLHELLKKINNDMFRENNSNVFHFIDGMSKFHLMRILYNNHRRVIEELIDLDRYPFIHESLKFIFDKLEKHIIQACLGPLSVVLVFERDLFTVLYENSYDFVVDIIKRYFRTLMLKNILLEDNVIKVYKEFAYEHETEYLEFVNFDICEAYYEHENIYYWQRRYLRYDVVDV